MKNMFVFFCVDLVESIWDQYEVLWKLVMVQVGFLRNLNKLFIFFSIFDIFGGNNNNVNWRYQV